MSSPPLFSQDDTIPTYQVSVANSLDGEAEDSWDLRIQQTGDDRRESDQDSVGSGVLDGQKFTGDDDEFDFFDKSQGVSDTVAHEGEEKVVQEEELKDIPGENEFDMRSPRRNTANEDLKNKILGDFEAGSEEDEDSDVENVKNPEDAVKDGDEVARKEPRLEKKQGRSVTREIWDDITGKEKRKRKLEEEVETLRGKLKEAEEGRKNRDVRIAIMEEKVSKQEEELEKQATELLKKKILEKEVGKKEMGELEKGLDEAIAKVGEMKYNVDRLNNGRDKAESGPKSGTLKALNKYKDKLVIFCPGSLEEMDMGFKEDLQRTENIQVVPYGESGAPEMVQMVINHGDEEMKNDVGVIVLWLQDGLISRNKLMETANIEDYMDMLRIITTGSGRKFNKMIIVIPPSKGSDLKALEVLTEKVANIEDKKTGKVNLLKKQKEMGDKLKRKEREVYQENDVMLAKAFRKMEDEDGESRTGLNKYSFYRCLSELVLRLKLSDGKESVCERCGDIHGDGDCKI